MASSFASQPIRLAKHISEISAGGQSALGKSRYFPRHPSGIGALTPVHRIASPSGVTYPTGHLLGYRGGWPALSQTPAGGLPAPNPIRGPRPRRNREE